MEEKKENNNTIWIIILIVGLIVLAIVGYFTYTKSKADKDDTLTPNTTEKTDKDKDTDTGKTDKDVVGTYSSKDDNSLGEDIKDATEGTDTTKTMELVLESDKTAKVAHLTDVVSGTYTVDTNKITVTIQNNTTDTTDKNNTDTTTDSRKSTYEFTINSDDTLSHIDDNGKTITLKKINKSDLKYIK